MEDFKDIWKRIISAPASSLALHAAVAAASNAHAALNSETIRLAAKASPSAEDWRRWRELWAAYEAALAVVAAEVKAGR